MIGENRQLVTNEPVGFEKSPVEVQDYRKITNRFRGIYGIYLNVIKENRRMSTCNRLDLQTLRSQPIMPKNLPDHWLEPDGKSGVIGAWEASLSDDWCADPVSASAIARKVDRLWQALGCSCCSMNIVLVSLYVYIHIFIRLWCKVKVLLGS